MSNEPDDDDNYDLPMGEEADLLDGYVIHSENVLEAWLWQTNETAFNAFRALNLVRFYRDQLEAGRRDERFRERTLEALKVLENAIPQLGGTWPSETKDESETE